MDALVAAPRIEEVVQVGRRELFVCSSRSDPAAGWS